MVTTMPTSAAESKAGDFDVLLDRERIAQRVRELGAEISADYRGRPVRLIGILKGAWIFLADLIRHLRLDEVSVDFLGVASYGASSRSSGEVQITKDLDMSIEGIDVLIVEDILDTGETFHYLMRVLGSRKPKTLRVVTLLDKPARRTRPVNADYIGFTIPDAFVIGYGLDLAQKYRELPDVCIIRPTPEKRP
jgi:hypoxanthine phosphoribosyltransferase